MTNSGEILMDYMDCQGKADERRWIARMAKDGGIVVEACDDTGRVFDQLHLVRGGAFIVVDPTVAQQELPEPLEFLQPLLDMKNRARALGMSQETPPVLIHTATVKQLFDMGYLPSALRRELQARGHARLFGLDVAWSHSLDEYAHR